MPCYARLRDRHRSRAARKLGGDGERPSDRVTAEHRPQPPGRAGLVLPLPRPRGSKRPARRRLEPVPAATPAAGAGGGVELARARRLAADQKLSIGVDVTTACEAKVFRSWLILEAEFGVKYDAQLGRRTASCNASATAACDHPAEARECRRGGTGALPRAVPLFARRVRARHRPLRRAAADVLLRRGPLRTEGDRLDAGVGQEGHACRRPSGRRSTKWALPLPPPSSRLTGAEYGAPGTRGAMNVGGDGAVPEPPGRADAGGGRPRAGGDGPGRVVTRARRLACARGDRASLFLPPYAPVAQPGRVGCGTTFEVKAPT